MATLDGVVTDLAPIGTVLDHGRLLYRIDGVPVTAIEPVDPVAAVLLSDSFTVVELEEALAAGGHDPDGDMTVDSVVTAATEAAVTRWQEAGGLPASGLADPSGYWPASPDRAVAAHVVADGQDLSTGGPVLTAAASQLSVSVTVDVADADEFAVDQVVEIELADGRTVQGTVTEIGAVTQAADPHGDPDPDRPAGRDRGRRDLADRGPGHRHQHRRGRGRSHRRPHPGPAGPFRGRVRGGEGRRRGASA